MIVKMIDLQYPFPFVYLHVKIGSILEKNFPRPEFINY